MFSRKHSNWFWFAKLLKFKHNNVRVKCFKKECKHCGTKKGVIGRKKWWIVTSLVIKWKKLWFVTSFVKKVWCTFPPFPRVILNTSWRAGRCPWKKKFIFKNYFLAFVTPRVPMTAYNKFQPIRSSRSAGYTANICESLVLLYKKCNSPCFHPQRHNPPSSCSPPPR